MNDNSYRVIEVDINEILPNRFQPRIQFDEEEILELSDSIKEHGVIQPIVVRTIGDKYEIIAGERRYKASVLAGRESVPVIIKNLNDKDSAEIALIENIQRKNLTPIEEALSYKKILDMGYLTQESLAVKLGKSQSSVANKIRLLNLSDEVQEALLDNKISERHARSLLRLKTIDDQNKMLNRIIQERLTVRKTDEEINKILTGTEEGEEKIKEKGDSNMNNEINQIPNIVTQQGNTFDIFGGVQSESTFREVPQPTSTMVQEIPSIQSTFEFNPQPSVQTVETTTPVVEQSVVGQTSMPTFEFNPQPSVQAVETTTPVVEQSVISQMSSTIPNTMPIIESNKLEEDKTNVEQISTPIIETPINQTPIVEQKNEFIAPEPIIITDYTKQYDPIMPAQVEQSVKIDFKEIINAIRECSAKIEKYGYKLDVEEYDLSTLYQVIFKIEK